MPLSHVRLEANYRVRVKDIAQIEGVRKNQLLGYGLVVGLQGTGDDLQSTPQTLETMVSMLERSGVNIRDQLGKIKSKNAAAVMVTADLPAFSTHGSTIDVNVAAVGSAKDLSGGTLIATPLKGADDQVYAVAQGSVNTGGFSATGNAESVTKGIPTSGRITSGATIEKEIDFNLSSLKTLRLSLRNPDFTTAFRLAEAINRSMGHLVKNETKDPKGLKKNSAPLAKAIDATSVQVQVPPSMQDQIVSYINQIEQVTLSPDQSAKIVIDERNGVIVMGKDVRISSVAVSHGNLTIRITETPQVSQPNPFTQVQEATRVDRTNIDIEEGKGKLAVLQEGVTLQELVDTLNSLGVGTRDMITILRTIKASGALQAEIIVN